jgi:hypothetical protein
MIVLEFQDNRGFRGLTRINMFRPDISTDSTVNSALYADVVAVAAAVAAGSNSKLVRVGYSWDFDYAQEPSSETGTYQLVQQKARLDGGDGNGGFQHMSIPAPVDAMFLTTTQDDLIVVDPASTVVTGIQAALAAGVFKTPRLGQPFSQFFGGQLIEGKPRRRRVLQGA